MESSPSTKSFCCDLGLTMGTSDQTMIREKGLVPTFRVLGVLSGRNTTSWVFSSNTNTSEESIGTEHPSAVIIH
jgi:hypothetical protein